MNATFLQPKENTVLLQKLYAPEANIKDVEQFFEQYKAHCPNCNCSHVISITHQTDDRQCADCGYTFWLIPRGSRIIQRIFEICKKQMQSP